MGGKPTTDVALKLDLAGLRPLGLFEGKVVDVPLLRGHNQAGSVVVGLLGDGLAAVGRQVVALDRTPCTFGGVRTWWRCPCCKRRCRVLWSRGGPFACRTCYGLAYASTHDDPMRRAIRRAQALRRRLGVPPQPWWLPVMAKPDAMHWDTFYRRSDDLERAQRRAGAAIDAVLTSLEADTERVLARIGARPDGPD